MTEPFIGQLEIFGFNFAPRGWALSTGQLLPLRQYTALFSLLGVNFGGDGTVTFGLPNLASNQGCGSGQGPGLTPRSMGETFGEFSVTLNQTQLPMHTHALNVFNPDATETVAPGNNSGIGIVENGTYSIYGEYAAPQTNMYAMMVQPAGGNQPHQNQQPYLGLNYSIALEGVFPSFS